jgi:hypothetical protein
MKKARVVKSRVIPPPDDTFERMKRVYISQIQKTDSHPQKVIIDQDLDCGESLSRVSRRGL